MRFGKAASAKHKTTKLLFLCVGLLGAFLIVDLLWASSSSSSSAYRSISSNWPRQGSQTFVVPSVVHTNNRSVSPQIKGTGKQDKKDGVHERVLSATFADLPGPQLKWEKMATAPVPRLDGAAIQIKDLLYVFAGYGTINDVHSHVDIYNFTDNTWGGRFDMPKEMAHSHLGMVTDGRYIYVVTGQYGPQCRGPTARTFVLDTDTKQWRDMPLLPVPSLLILPNTTSCGLSATAYYLPHLAESPSLIKLKPPPAFHLHLLLISGAPVDYAQVGLRSCFS